MTKFGHKINDDVYTKSSFYSPTGCSEMLMANAVSQLAARTPGKEAVAIESFAKALRQV